MLIEFGLPQGAGGMAAAHESSTIRSRLREWSNQYKITIKIASTRHDYRHWITVEFDKEQDLTVFALTWSAKTFMRWQRVKQD